MMKNPELIYLFCLVLFDLVVKIVCAYVAIITPDTGTLKWVIIAYAMSSYNFFKLVFNVGYFLIWSKKIHSHRYKAIYRALYGFSYAVIDMGMGLYLENKINTYGLYGFATTYVIISTTIFIIEVFRKSEYRPIAFYYILESVQMLLI